MKKLLRLSAIAPLFFSLSVNALPTPYTEVGDAGETLATAQAVGGGYSAITGNLASDADLFSFFWGGGNFYANTVGSTGDTQLFLFDSAGVGIFGNDDGIESAGPAYVQGPLASGSYYIGVSSYDYDPRAAGGSLIFPSRPYAGLFGPITGAPLDHWAGSQNDTLTYYINFEQITSNGTPTGTGGTTGGGTNVPEPGTFTLLGLGLIGLGFSRKKKAA